MKDNQWMINDGVGVWKKHDILSDDGIAVVLSLSDAPARLIKTDWVMVCVLTSGCVTCTINGAEYELHVHDMFVALPETVLVGGTKSGDYSMDCLCISREAMAGAIHFSMFNWDVMTLLHSHPVFSLTEDDFTRFSLFYALMSDKLEHQEQFCHKESMQCLLKSFMYDFYDVISRDVEVAGNRYSQGKNLFKNFLNLLYSSHPKSRTVAFYAERLNVTSKYLSSVCKEACGSTASVLIDQAVMKDIVDLLTYSNKSIKEIMVDLDFPSLSFFGKYVKKHLGVGPKEYRARNSAQYDV